MGEMTYVPPNLAPPRRRRDLGFGPFYCGIAIPHGEPAMLDIWEAAVRSMIETYPEADRYWVCTGSEAHIAASDPKTPGVHPRLRRRAPAASAKASGSDGHRFGRRCRGRQADAQDQGPLSRGQARSGADFPRRPAPALDAVLPKDVWLMNMVNWDGETAMSDFDKIQGRELVVWPRITDDGGELNIQLNAMMYDHDETISGSVRYGLTGVLGQLNKARGAEHSAQYIAEGAWNPAIRCRSFYQRYLGRLFGPDAQAMLVKSILAPGRKRKDPGLARKARDLRHLSPRQPYGRWAETRQLQEGKAKTRSPAGGKSHPGRRRRAAVLGRSRGPLPAGPGTDAAARPKVLPGSRDELDYVIYKTENFITRL